MSDEPIESRERQDLVNRPLSQNAYPPRPFPFSIFGRLRARGVEIVTDRQAARPGALRAQRILGMLALAIAIATTPGFEARSEPGTPMQSLDQQVQDIKSDVLAITAELRSLEEQLLYPSETQLAIFVAMPEGEDLALDAARISIDDEAVAHHIYTWKELEALKKGGVQRIYTGNVQTGEHRLEVAVKGERIGGSDYDSVTEYVFEKGIDPKKLIITLDPGLAGSPSIEISDW